MAIEDELSSEIAIALLTGKERDPERLNSLREVVLKVHACLHEKSGESRINGSSSTRREETKRSFASKV